MQLEFNVIKPVLELVINLVISWEAMFGDSKDGLEKKKEVWAKAISQVYDVADALLQFADHVDALVKNVLIPQAIDLAVDFFNQENDKKFDEAKTPSAITYLAHHLPMVSAA